MAVGEVDTLEMTVFLDSISVTGLRVSWIADDPTALSIRTMAEVLDAAANDSFSPIDSLPPEEFLGIELKAEIVALKRGKHLLRFSIDSAGFFKSEAERDSFNAFLRDEGQVEIITSERWESIAVSRDHSCALTYNDEGDAYQRFETSLRAGGEAFCWGDGPDGALGTGGLGGLEPTPVVFDESFFFISAGAEHTCALDTNFFAYCWGGNERGQLGIGNDLDQFVPRLIALGVPFQTPGLGDEFTCGLPTSLTEFVIASATCWGSNVEGQLGCDDGDPNNPCLEQSLNDKGDQLTPSEDVKRASGEDLFFSTVGVGSRHACGIDAGSPGQGTIWCWGDNSLGQLGVSSVPDCTRSGAPVDTFPCSRLAVQIQGPGGGAPLNTFLQVDGGGEFTCAQTNPIEGGDIYCWGRNDEGQLGNGTNTVSDAPVLVVTDGITSPFASATVGGAHACATTFENVAYCWGLNSDGQLGDGTTTSRNRPVAVAGGLKFAFLAAGTNHTCGVVFEPVTVTEPADTAGLPPGSEPPGDSEVFLAFGGPIYCWGSNQPIGEGEGGKLGNGATEDSPFPVRIAEPFF